MGSRERDARTTALDLALSQVKRVEREVRIAKQMLAQLRDEQSKEDTSNE